MCDGYQGEALASYAFFTNSVPFGLEEKHKVPPGLRFADTLRNDDAVDTLFLKPI